MANGIHHELHAEVGAHHASRPCAFLDGGKPRTSCKRKGCSAFHRGDAVHSIPVAHEVHNLIVVDGTRCVLLAWCTRLT